MYTGIPICSFEADPAFLFTTGSYPQLSPRREGSQSSDDSHNFGDNLPYYPDPHVVFQRANISIILAILEVTNVKVGRSANYRTTFKYFIYPSAWGHDGQPKQLDLSLSNTASSISAISASNEMKEETAINNTTGNMALRPRYSRITVAFMLRRLC